MDSSPVLLVIKADGCGWCTKLSSVWDAMEVEIKKSHPKLRVVQCRFTSTSGTFDYTKIPYGVGRLPGAYPSLFFVPGPLWDLGVENLHKGNKNNINFVVPTVQGMNYTLSKNGESLVFQYDQQSKKTMFSSSDIISWLNECSANKHYIALEKKEKKEKNEVKTEKKFGHVKIIKPCPTYQIKGKK
jgi:hypothetical protein